MNLDLWLRQISQSTCTLHVLTEGAYWFVCRNDDWFILAVPPTCCKSNQESIFTTQKVLKINKADVMAWGIGWKSWMQIVPERQCCSKLLLLKLQMNRGNTVCVIVLLNSESVDLKYLLFVRGGERKYCKLQICSWKLPKRRKRFVSSRAHTCLWVPGCGPRWAFCALLLLNL